MPFQSQAQRRFFYAKASQDGEEGKKWKKYLAEMRAKTPKGKKLPERVKTAAYTEHGSFTHDGVRYSMPKALSRSHKKKTRSFRVSDLSWVLKYDTPSPARVRKADLSAPILVARDKKGRLTAVDGLHRLSKAVQEGNSALPGKYLSQADLRMIKSASQVAFEAGFFSELDKIANSGSSQ